MHYIPISKGDSKYNASASEDGNMEKVSLHAVNFVFKCLVVDQDSKSRAVFELAEDIFDGFKPTISESMSSCLFSYLMPEDEFLQPRHHVTIGKGANDTELPGLEWIDEKLELSVSWKEMYSKYLGEEDACRRERHNAVGSLLIIQTFERTLTYASLRVRGRRCGQW